ncbi:DNA polymerase [Halobacillus andaensis]|uniref:DNA polymerase n=1 Tax=Halobacillus andaensis TaxID=1176239 RepID=A0A917BA51_HALAA|nr:uracil-DNA glycosylase [Halobacillus andaensis]MBP2006270.1 DNA polymerase [Halobacillus andaensis]GGF33886.1 DNA polymerase [Halobacillus andaensis]
MRIPEQIIEKANKNIKDCDVEGFVLGGGSSDAEIVIVGEAPGEHEAVKGVPFIGRAGDELDKQFEYIGIKREEVYITSAVRSRPYKWVKTTKKGSGGSRKANRKPNKKEIWAHAPILDYQLNEIAPKLIIALGGVALERLLGKGYKITDVLGKVIESPILEVQGEDYGWSEKRYAIFPLYHPAAVFYNPRIKDDIYQSLDRLKEYMNHLD